MVRIKHFVTRKLGLFMRLNYVYNCSPEDLPLDLVSEEFRAFFSLTSCVTKFNLKYESVPSYSQVTHPNFLNKEL